MNFLYISTVLHFHMYVCYMLINESVSQSVDRLIKLISSAMGTTSAQPREISGGGVGLFIGMFISPILSLCVCVCE